MDHDGGNYLGPGPSPFFTELPPSTSFSSSSSPLPIDPVPLIFGGKVGVSRLTGYRDLHESDDIPTIDGIRCLSLQLLGDIFPYLEEEGWEWWGREGEEGVGGGFSSLFWERQFGLVEKCVDRYGEEGEESEGGGQKEWGVGGRLCCLLGVWLDGEWRGAGMSLSLFSAYIKLIRRLSGEQEGGKRLGGGVEGGVVRVVSKVMWELLKITEVTSGRGTIFCSFFHFKNRLFTFPSSYPRASFVCAHVWPFFSLLFSLYVWSPPPSLFSLLFLSHNSREPEGGEEEGEEKRGKKEKGQIF